MRKFFLCALCCFVALAGVCGVPHLYAQDEPLAEAVVDSAALPSALPAEESAPAAQATPTLRPLTITAGLTDDTRITGTLLDSTSIAIKTAFGEAAIPLSEVAGIRFPSAEDTSTTIAMLNGDSITGATDVKFVNVETSWGHAKINGQSVATMLFVPGLKWSSQDSLGGKRWTLAEDKPAPATTAPRQQANNGIPQNGIPQRGAPQVIFGR